jgi:hypothetical protein
MALQARRQAEGWEEVTDQGVLFDAPTKFDPFAPIPGMPGYPPYSCMIVWRSVVVDELRDWLAARSWQA